jgi:FtsZ-interacting cell division protein ZipA
MPTWGWVLIAIGAVAVVALVVRLALAQRRTDRLQGRFGPEYDRTVGATDSKRKAEADLAAREERREELQIRTLSPGARDRYVERWQVVQAQFVDDPRAAVASADSLIQAVMQERGYPVEDFEQRAADVSVDHPEVVENYRQGHQLAEASAKGSDSTEDLRQAMRHYRALFDELVDSGSDAPIERERRSDDADSVDREQDKERTVR